MPDAPLTTPPDPVPFTRLKQCRHGLMLYNINDQYVGRSLDLYGEFSEGETAIFRQILRPGDIAVEVGANIGAHTVFLAKAVGETGAVLALEPQRLVYQMLCANVALNSLTNVWTTQLAAGSAAGTIHVPVLDPRSSQNVGGLPLGGEGAGGDVVGVVRGDDLGIGRCRLLKVDVEGMELDVLKGFAGVIAKHSPAMYVENDRPDRSAELVRYIDSLGYAMFWHRPPLFNPDNFLKHPENVFDTIVSINMLCVPKHTAASINGLPRVDLPRAETARVPDPVS